MLELPVFHNLNTFDSNRQLATNCSMTEAKPMMFPCIYMRHILEACNIIKSYVRITKYSYKPYRKLNDDPLYINKHSNHLPSILRQLPTSINKRISTLSSDKQTFEDAAPAYQNALGHSNFSRKLEYTRRMKHNDPAGIGSAMSFG